MATLRSRRLEALLRAAVADASYEQVAALANSKVGEDFDLDFKGGVYANTDKGRRDLAIDVAAMANTAGGLIVLGMDEDDQARALGPTELPIGDDEVNRMLQIIAAGIAPLPAYDIRIIENPDKPGTGFVLVAVPRSPMAPHAVLVNDSLRYPRRNGRTTTYLSEPDVAQAYRERFVGLQSRLDAAAEHEEYLTGRLNTDKQSYVVVTLVPDLDGHADIDFKAFRAFQAEMMEQDPLIVYSGSTWKRASVGAGRLIADGGYGDDSRMSWLGCVLHRTGAGSFAVAIENRDDGQEPADVLDERLVSGVMSGLLFLARHARDRAGAGGSASLRATITPAFAEVPTRLVHRRSLGGGEQVLGRVAIYRPPVATALADVDDLAEGGAALLAATHDLASGLMQEFGHPEAVQVSPEGDLRIRYWIAEVQEHLRRWAEANGVNISNDRVD